MSLETREVQGRRARIKHVFALSTPLFATVVLRLAQLLTLLVFSWLGGEQGAVVVMSMGMVTGLLILLDSGGSAYLLSRGRQAATIAEYVRVLQVQGSMAALVLLLGLIASFLRSPALLEGLWLPFVAVIVAQMLETVLRPARAPWLQKRRDLRYALPELYLGLSKIGVLVAVWASSDLRLLVVLPAISAIVLLFSIVRVHSMLRRGGHRPKILDIWAFGVAGSLSALYSQSPVVLAGFLMSPQEAAGLVLAFRFVQAAEVLPATVSNQILSRIDGERWRWWGIWAVFLAVGTGMTAFLLYISDYLEALSGATWLPLMFGLVAISLTPKSGNYGLSAVLFAFRLPSVKAKITAGVGVLSVSMYVLVGGSFGSVGLAWITLASEVVLALSLAAGLVLLRSRIGKSNV